MALTTKPTYPAVNLTAIGRQDIPGNDSKHDLADPQGGGSPRLRPNRIPPKHRGGFGQHGQKPTSARAGMSGGRSSSGNPASRGGFRGEARSGAETAETRIPGHGGSPQHRGGTPISNRGGFGQNERSRVSAAPHANPQPGPGNVRGTAAKRVIGRFQRKAMGAMPGGSDMKGQYGGAPVTQNT